MVPQRSSSPQNSLIDRHVGELLRALREAVPLTGEELAQKLDVSIQLLADYEIGTARCPASTLYLASVALNVHIAAFFEGFDKTCFEQR